MQLTVFTPTYNRANLLARLYKSLLAQTHKNFEWIIVNDGSTDNTDEVVGSFMADPKDFNIVFIKQANSGKHIAINTAVKIALGELFFIVDSDDYLTENSLELIISEWSKVPNHKDYAGIVPNKCTSTTTPLGKPTYKYLDCNPIDFRYKYNQKGDKAEVIRTDLFKLFPFPEGTPEKFCPEGLFFNRLYQYKLRYLNENIYICEYLPDGLTSSSFKVRKRSPINTCSYYLELSRHAIPFIYRLRAGVNFYRFKRYTKEILESPFRSFILTCISILLANIVFVLRDRKFVD